MGVLFKYGTCLINLALCCESSPCQHDDLKMCILKNLCFMDLRFKVLRTNVSLSFKNAINFRNCQIVKFFTLKRIINKQNVCVRIEKGYNIRVKQ
jgi:hypothetical protein